VAVGVLILVFAWIAWESLSFPPRARIFPQLVALIALALSGLELVRMWWPYRPREREKTEANRREGDTRPRSAAVVLPPLRDRFRAVVPFIAWVGLYYVAILLLGFPFASFLFVVTFLRWVAEVRWSAALLGGAAVLGFLFLLAVSLNVTWPMGIIPESLGVAR
jgi:hypothetical protein